jgi:hypothetical protein
LLHSGDDHRDGAREDVLVAKRGLGSQGGEDGVCFHNGVGDGYWVKGAALYDAYALTE